MKIIPINFESTDFERLDISRGNGGYSYYKQAAVLTLALIGLLFSTLIQAENTVIVIPMAGDALKPLKNIVTVAKANGDFIDPVAAMDSIDDANANNPYLIVIAPGVYTLSSVLIMKEYVDVTGSGENVTRLTGAISSGAAVESALVELANNTVLSHLSVANTGGDTFSVGIYSTGRDNTARLEKVTATASGATVTNYGVFNSSSSPTLTQVTAIALGSTNSYGVRNNSSSPTMTQVTASGSGGTHNYGVRNSSSSAPTMTQVTAAGSGGTFSYGVFNNTSSSPTMTQVTATATGGTISYGVYSVLSSSPIIRRSTLKGTTYGIYIDAISVFVSQSTIIGGVFGSATLVCIASDNGAGKPLNSDCTEP